MGANVLLVAAKNRALIELSSIDNEKMYHDKAAAMMIGSFVTVTGRILGNDSIPRNWRLKTDKIKKQP
ncbi:hypothetical protein EDM59_12835 [Brevibacillus nitrificans]|uniref:Uncharacterized protein n=1 Tax=Brevibacillus nitrificans TaxID=651560 RepID=A0A3M8DB80_9BACL|nr:hypothetical protein EDM59_12835 [Brevibacillus nitrificans]